MKLHEALENILRLMAEIKQSAVTDAAMRLGMDADTPEKSWWIVKVHQNIFVSSKKK